MFFLIADVEIRRRTGNRMGLQHVLQFTVAEGGNITQEWTVERFNAAAARATGTRSFQEEGLLQVARGVTSLQELQRILKREK